MNKGLTSIHLNKTFSMFIILLAGCILLSTPAFAAQCVRPSGTGGCHASIQDAIDAVRPGGTVQVYPGIYYENITVNKSGITIEGMGTKRTDVRVDLQRLTSFSITSANVIIKNLTIQNGVQGIFINSGGDNSRILKVNISNSMNNGIYIVYANDVLVKNCKILKSGYDGVNIEGDSADGKRLTVKDTTISDCGEDGIFCNGDELTVTGCTIKNALRHLIFIDEPYATIHDNKLFNAGIRGIYAHADFVKVTGNLVRGTGQEGIMLEGEAPVVKNNAVMYCQDDGIWISCRGGCADSKVVNNLSNYNLYQGFWIFLSSSGMLIKNNRAFNNGYAGIFISGPYDKTLMKNQAKYNILDGFVVFSYGILEDNEASENGGTGFYLTDHITALQNKALNNMTAGFTVQSSNNLLRNNRAIGNLSHGIHVTDDNNAIINNTMLDSLYDKCDEGAGNTWTGNNYDTECP